MQLHPRNRRRTTTIAALTLAASVLATGCAEDETDVDLEVFCAEYRNPAGAARGPGGFRTFAAVSQTSAFFQRLEQTAPEQIADDVSTVADGLESMVAALNEFEGAEGPEAITAVQEAADVNLDEMAQAAEEVEQFAIENCEGVEPTE